MSRNARVAIHIPGHAWFTGSDSSVGRNSIRNSMKEKEVAPSVVDALLQIVWFGSLPPGDYDDVWSWLILQPSILPICEGRRVGSHLGVIRRVRRLRDIGILKSYLLLVWSE